MSTQPKFAELNELAPNIPIALEAGVLLALGSHPGESIAFFAEHLALALLERKQPEDRVLLLDLATPAGAGTIFLNLNQTYCVLDALRDGARCDRTLIETRFSRHSKGLYVLGLPEDLVGRPSYDDEMVRELLGTLREHFRWIVVAADGQMSLPLLVTLVERSERALLLTDQSILKSRQNKYLLRALRQLDCPTERLALVVDNYRRRLGLEPGNLAELYQLPLAAVLQTESYNRIISMNSGEPLFVLAPKDPYCIGVRDLAHALLSGEMKTAAQAGGLISRWFS